MAQKKVIVIGAGIAGLSAGCYARMNNFDTQIFEQHTIPGGLCTSWKTAGFRINGCAHWVMGTKPGNGGDMYTTWTELGAVQGREWVEFDEYLRFCDADGRSVVFYVDIARLERSLLEGFPDDRAAIQEMIAGVRSVRDMHFPLSKDPSLYSFADRVRQFNSMWPLTRHKKIWLDLSLAEYAKRFRDPLLRRAISSFFAPEFPAFFLPITMASLADGSSRFPIGGSLQFATAIERRYCDLGGRIQYSATVDKILIDKGRAFGVRLADGSEHLADYVIAAGDVHGLVHGMLKGRYGTEWLAALEQRLSVFPTVVFVSLGVNRSFEGHPAQALGTFMLSGRPLQIGNSQEDIVLAHVYGFERGDRPAGRTVITVTLAAEYAYWAELRKNDPEAYEEKKRAAADQVIELLETHYPGISGQIEMVDVATPATYERYTFAWRGSIEGWLLRPQDLVNPVSKTLPGLENLYMVGHWVEPGGGLPIAAASGRFGIQLICKKERRKFVTSLPDAEWRPGRRESSKPRDASPGATLREGS